MTGTAVAIEKQSPPAESQYRPDVDVFFVISGFLISGIILGHLEKGKFRFRDFYIRRIRRIFPSLLFVLVSCLVAGWFLLFADEYKMLGKHSVGGAGFFANFLLLG